MKPTGILGMQLKRWYKNLHVTLNFTHTGSVSISMDKYINDLIDSLEATMPGYAATPTAAHLFEVRTDSKEHQISPSNAVQYHHIVARLLFLCHRACPDIQMAVAFLCTRVKALDVDDYKKLCRVICYLRHTKSLHLTLSGTQINILKWYADASFASHDDMCGHSGGALLIGKGAIYSTSTCQKINTRSSTCSL